ncbi:DUF2203 domain-containing protein [Paenibacillus sp. GP183]|uniref:DUF2203 domain-containing protein n=1 Tax=Paenibacillus sp. GP183 TaxID=1882751 RepID=UPI00089A6632|nr:DUF2203 domain-containing protein [Paenibacillus sp. GP183]SEC55807.1 hypothetical protein SAMN05443246_4508 [Paenibacillus sp. GP183]
MAAKYFTLAEANELIPVVDQILRALQLLKRKFEVKHLELKKLKEFSYTTESGLDSDHFFTLEAELEFLQIEAKNHIQSFQMKGIELKDIDIGLVDFPAVLEDQEVLLCWRQGEAKIEYYHTRYDGFAGRKPISE